MFLETAPIQFADFTIMQCADGEDVLMLWDTSDLNPPKASRIISIGIRVA